MLTWTPSTGTWRVRVDGYGHYWRSNLDVHTHTTAAEALAEVRGRIQAFANDILSLAASVTTESWPPTTTTITREWVEWRLRLATVQMVLDQEYAEYAEYAAWEKRTQDRKHAIIQALQEELYRVREEQPPMTAAPTAPVPDEGPANPPGTR